MNVEHLVKMANEIGAFYVAESAADAAQNIASHLKRFWEPRMRKTLIEHNKKGGIGLKADVRKAVELLATT